MAASIKHIEPSFDSEILKVIQRFLFFADDENFFSDTNTSKDNSSQWEDVETESDGESESIDENDQSLKSTSDSSKLRRSQEFWLRNVHVATIPTFEFYVFARGGRIVAVESFGESSQWRILFQKELSDLDVTTVVCLPIAPSRVSDPRPYEWTSVLIGTLDGRMTAFSERGDELLSQRFYTKSISEMRLEFDQLLVTYPDYLITISGFTLLASLKANRQRLIRQNVPRSHDGLESGNSVTPLLDSQLVYDSWHLENVSQPTNIVVTGTHRTTIWEKLATASVKGGFNASVSNRQPSYETYCATNRKNFVSFNWWTDEIPPNILAGIASRIKSSVSVPIFSSWWSSSKSSQRPSDASSSNAAVVPVTSRDISQRSCLPDNGRVGERLILAPGNRLALVCDDLGRVSMFDIHRRLLLRMWKGYRDAQCAWIELPYSGNEKKIGATNHSSVLCLAIYAPRRGILEIWSAQNGKRIAAFNVDRRGLLLYCQTTSMTRSNSIDNTRAVRFMDSTGHFSIIEISAAAVTERHETATYWTIPARDEFNKRWNNSLIDESNLLVLLDVLKRLVIVKDITYLVDRVVQCTNIDYKLFIRFIDVIIDRLSKNIDQSPETKSLYIRCLAYRQITHFVALLCNYYERESDAAVDYEETNSNVEEVHQLFDFETADDLNNLLRDLDANLKVRCVSNCGSNQSTDLNPLHALQLFLSSIDYRISSHGSFSPSVNIASEETLILRLKKDADDTTTLATLGDFIFKPVLTGVCTIEQFRRNTQPLLGMVERDWMKIFCAYWLHKDRSYSVHPENLYNLFHSLFTRENVVNKDLETEFIREIRRLIIDCPRIAEALCLCMVVRAILSNCASRGLGNDGSGWLKVEKTVEDWDILYTTLHAVLLLDTCCRQLITEGSTKQAADFEPISLRQLLFIGNAGCLSELFAKSFVTVGLPANADALLETNSDHHPSPAWLNSLSAARELLPQSLETERLILGIVWEYVRVWSRSPTRTDCLESASQLLVHIQDERLRQGYASLAWRTFCCQYFEKLCSAMTASNGKDCSEAFERDVGIPAIGLLEFVKFVYILFNAMKESAERWEENVSKLYGTEEFLANFFVAFRRDVSDEKAGSHESLWQLLSRQPVNNKYRIELHWQLSVSILVAVSTHFQMRFSPLGLFSWDERADLFKSLADDVKGGDESKFLDEDVEQQQLDNRRLLFLLSYVTVAIKSSLPSTPDGEYPTSDKNLLPDLSLAVKLARSWNLNFDAVRRQEVVQLYLSGHPDLASKLLPLVEDKRQLATTLLDIAGCALSDRWTTCQTTIRPKLTSSSWNWLMSKKSSITTKGPELSLDACNSMLAYVSSVMSTGTMEQKLCDEFISVIDSLK